jgi:tetratricopeptide (TPR) repeat protein
MKRLILLSMMLLASPWGHCQETPLPANGFKAEQEGRWEDAVGVYNEALRVDQNQIGIWLRLADIHAHLQQPQATAEALARAAALRPGDATLWKKLSEAQAVADDKQAAFVAINKGVELAPDDVVYLRAQAQLAVWSSHPAVAITAYQRILALAPEDAAAWLALARVNSWDGQTDAAINQYSAYLKQQPDDKAVWLELIKNVGWCGDFPAALDYLDQYQQRFGEDRNYLELRARTLAWMGKTTDALEMVQGLVQATPDDPEVLTTRLIARNLSNQTDAALEDLKAIETIRPDGAETLNLHRSLMNPLRSSISYTMNYGGDSSELHSAAATLEGELVLNTHTRLLAGIEEQRLDAPAGSGLENIDGSERADYRRVWGGVRHRFSPAVAGEVQLGAAQADGNHDFGEYRLALDWRPSDNWTLRPEIEHALYAISPKAVSLHIERDTLRLQTHWTPGTRYTVDGAFTRDNYTDGNSRWEVVLAPRRQLLRTQRFNMDIGLNGTWSGFDKKLNNGYYDPAHFERYAVTGFMYWKINDDNGVSLAVSLGRQKDDSMDDFQTGGDAVVQGHFGINRDWYLRAFAAWMHNVQATSGAYRSNTAGLVLTRRF